MLSEWVSVSGDASSSGLSAGRTHDDALQCLAHCDKAPERDEQLARQGGPREGGDHRLARARTAIGSAGLVSPCSAAHLKQQKAPGELDHAAADPGVAGFGEPLFPPLRATLVRCASQAGVVRHRFAVTHLSREHPLDEHISRFQYRCRRSEPGAEPWRVARSQAPAFIVFDEPSRFP
jgi:hypothetical protein